MRRQNLYNMAAMAALAGVMMAGSVMSAFATGWQENEKGRWYGTNEDNTEWYKETSEWIDDNGDNIAECYYFDKDGYTDPWGNQGYYNTNEDGAWREGSITQTRVVDWSKVSNVAYDVRDYDSQGVSKAAVDILLHTWEENKKYGDTSDNTPQSVYYTNGLYASYDYSKDGHPSWVRVDADDRELIFREPLKGADGAVESLKAKGYDAKWVTPYNHSWGIEITNLWDGRMTISGTVNGTNHFLKLEGHNSNYTNWGQDWGY